MQGVFVATSSLIREARHRQPHVLAWGRSEGQQCVLSRPLVTPWGSVACEKTPVAVVLRGRLHSFHRGRRETGRGCWTPYCRDQDPRQPVSTPGEGRRNGLATRRGTPAAGDGQPVTALRSSSISGQTLPSPEWLLLTVPWARLHSCPRFSSVFRNRSPCFTVGTADVSGGSFRVRLQGSQSSAVQ